MLSSNTLGTIAVTALLLTACGGDGSDRIVDDAAGAVSCDQPGEAGTTDGVLLHDGVERSYRLHVPSGLDPDVPVPLVVSLHGFGGDTIEHDEVTEFSRRAGERGYVVVTPQALELTLPQEGASVEGAGEFDGLAFWNFFGETGIDFPVDVPVTVDATELGVDDVSFIDELLREVGTDVCLDPDRVYAAGMSNGAGMATTLACELGDRLAAIGPVSGVNLKSGCPGDDPVSVLSIHGDEDVIVGYEGNWLYGFEFENPSVAERMAAWADLDGCDPDPESESPADGVVVTRWTGCLDGVDVELWSLQGWEHLWPDGTAPGGLHATDLLLDFFDAHTRVVR